jgi:hypothetical protein
MNVQRITLTILLMLALAACGAPATPPAGLPPSMATSEPVEAPTAAAGLDRLIIKNADLSMVVDDPPSAVGAITQLAETSGGFVVSVNTYQTAFGGQYAQKAEMVVRVPSPTLNEVLSQIKALAVEVRSENISGQDVTAEYVDLQSRLKNLAAKEEQLQAIMDRAADTEDVLKVYEELSQTREEIELILGQMKYYQEAAAMSAIRLDLLPNAASQPVELGGWHPELVVKQSVELLLRIGQSLVDIAIRLTIVCGPFILLLALPTILSIRWIRNRRQHIEPAEEVEG